METAKSKNTVYVCLVLTLASIIIYGYLTQQHYALVYGTGDSKSICNLSTKFNCDAVNISSYSTLLGPPIAVWGLATTVLLSLFLILRVFINSPVLQRLSFYLAAFELVASLVMGGISMLLLGTFCLFCITEYGLHFIIALLLFWSLRPIDFSQLKNDLQSLFKSWEGYTALLLIPGAAFLIHSQVNSSYAGDVGSIVRDSVEFWKRSEPLKFDESKGLALNGNSDAKMKILELADFGCGHCKHAAPSLHSFAQAHSKEVEFIFLTFPLDSQCNPAIQQPSDRCRLASMFECSKQQDRGWEAHDWLFEKQGQTVQSNPAEMASDLKLDLEKLKACIENPETLDLLRAQAEMGKMANIQGTPAIFVNNKALPPIGVLIPVLTGILKEVK